MPLTLISDRRRFLQFAATGVLSTVGPLGVTSPPSSATPVPRGSVPGGSPVTLALLSDTHVPGYRWLRHRGTHMAGNLAKAVSQIRQRLPATTPVIVNGDCAFLKGKSSDYRSFTRLIEPLIADGRDVHLTMGNHDDRDVCFEHVRQAVRPVGAVAGKHAAIIETAHANLFLLDSLQKVNQVTGELGPPQIEWLAGALDARRDRPAIVIAHHNLQTVQPRGKTVTGMLDSVRFQETMVARPWVRLFLYGHNHRWQRDTLSPKLESVNLPATAYVFDDDQPSGWVAATLTPNACELRLHTIDGDDDREDQVQTIALV